MAANPSRRSKSKPTLIRAIIGDKVVENELAERILSERYDITALNAKKESPLHIACERAFFRVVEILLKLGADPNARDWRHSTPLLRSIARAGSIDLVKLLLTHGAEVNTTSKAMNPPLDQAVTSKRIDIARLLIAAGADAHRVEIAGSVLHTAIATHDADICREVITWGMDLESENAIGQSPLSMAIICGRHDVIRVLLDAGCSPTRRSTCVPMSPLEVAEDIQDQPIVDLIKSHPSYAGRYDPGI